MLRHRVRAVSMRALGATQTAIQRWQWLSRSRKSLNVAHGYHKRAAFNSWRLAAVALRGTRCAAVAVIRAIAVRRQRSAIARICALRIASSRWRADVTRALLLQCRRALKLLVSFAAWRQRVARASASLAAKASVLQTWPFFGRWLWYLAGVSEACAAISRAQGHHANVAKVHIFGSWLWYLAGESKRRTARVMADGALARAAQIAAMRRWSAIVIRERAAAHCYAASLLDAREEVFKRWRAEASCVSSLWALGRGALARRRRAAIEATWHHWCVQMAHGWQKAEHATYLRLRGTLWILGSAVDNWREYSVQRASRQRLSVTRLDHSSRARCGPMFGRWLVHLSIRCRWHDAMQASQAWHARVALAATLTSWARTTESAIQQHHLISRARALSRSRIRANGWRRLCARAPAGMAELWDAAGARACLNRLARAWAVWSVGAAECVRLSVAAGYLQGATARRAEMHALWTWWRATLGRSSTKQRTSRSPAGRGVEVSSGGIATPAARQADPPPVVASRSSSEQTPSDHSTGVFGLEGTLQSRVSDEDEPVWLRRASMMMDTPQMPSERTPNPVSVRAGSVDFRRRCILARVTGVSPSAVAVTATRLSVKTTAQLLQRGQLCAVPDLLSLAPLSTLPSSEPRMPEREGASTALEEMTAGGPPVGSPEAGAAIDVSEPVETEAAVSAEMAEATPAPVKQRRVLARMAGVSPSMAVLATAVDGSPEAGAAIDVSEPVETEAAVSAEMAEATPAPVKQRRVLARMAGVSPSMAVLATSVDGSPEAGAAIDVSEPVETEAAVSAEMAEATPAPVKRRRVLARMAGVSPSMAVLAVEQVGTGSPVFTDVRKQSPEETGVLRRMYSAPPSSEKKRCSPPPTRPSPDSVPMQPPIVPHPMTTPTQTSSPHPSPPVPQPLLPSIPSMQHPRCREDHPSVAAEHQRRVLAHMAGVSPSLPPVCTAGAAATNGGAPTATSTTGTPAPVRRQQVLARVAGVSPPLSELNSRTRGGEQRSSSVCVPNETPDETRGSSPDDGLPEPASLSESAEEQDVDSPSSSTPLGESHGASPMWRIKMLHRWASLAAERQHIQLIGRGVRQLRDSRAQLSACLRWRSVAVAKCGRSKMDIMAHAHSRWSDLRNAVALIAGAAHTRRSLAELQTCALLGVAWLCKSRALSGWRLAASGNAERGRVARIITQRRVYLQRLRALSRFRYAATHQGAIDSACAVRLKNERSSVRRAFDTAAASTRVRAARSIWMGNAAKYFVRCATRHSLGRWSTRAHRRALLRSASRVHIATHRLRCMLSVVQAWQRCAANTRLRVRRMTLGHAAWVRRVVSQWRSAALRRSTAGRSVRTARSAVEKKSLHRMLLGWASFHRDAWAIQQRMRHITSNRLSAVVAKWRHEMSGRALSDRGTRERLAIAAMHQVGLALFRWSKATSASKAITIAYLRGTGFSRRTSTAHALRVWVSRLQSLSMLRSATGQFHSRVNHAHVTASLCAWKAASVCRRSERSLRVTRERRRCTAAFGALFTASSAGFAGADRRAKAAAFCQRGGLLRALASLGQEMQARHSHEADWGLAIDLERRLAAGRLQQCWLVWRAANEIAGFQRLAMRYALLAAMRRILVSWKGRAMMHRLDLSCILVAERHALLSSWRRWRVAVATQVQLKLAKLATVTDVLRSHFTRLRGRLQSRRAPADMGVWMRAILGRRAWRSRKDAVSVLRLHAMQAAELGRCTRLAEAGSRRRTLILVLRRWSTAIARYLIETESRRLSERRSSYARVTLLLRWASLAAERQHIQLIGRGVRQLRDSRAQLSACLRWRSVVKARSTALALPKGTVPLGRGWRRWLSYHLVSCARALRERAAHDFAQKRRTRRALAALLAESVRELERRASKRSSRCSLSVVALHDGEGAA
jgi:hypothetical protein